MPLFFTQLLKRIYPASHSSLFTIILVASLAGVALAADKPASALRPVLTVEVAAPLGILLDEQISANGNVAAWQETIIAAEVSGLRLAAFKVNVGAAVKRGQVLALFDDEAVRNEVAQARAALSEARAALAQAQDEAQRARDLSETGALSRQQVKQLLAAEQTAEARQAAAVAQLASQNLRLRHTRIIAPDDGTISARPALLGAVLNAGTELFRLIPQNRLEWRAEVTAAELTKLRPGQPVKLTGPSQTVVNGRVRALAPTADAQTRYALVYVDLPNSAQQAGLRPGTFARGVFLTGQSLALTVPMSALVMRDGFSWVYVLGPGNRVAQRKVGTGRQTGERIELTQGIHAGEQVVTSGGSFLADGDLVRVVKR